MKKGIKMVEQRHSADGFRDEDLERIRRATFVRTIEHYREMPSTNTRALVTAEDPAAELPTLILADLQTAGRGRGAHHWWSSHGALTFSLIFPRGSVDQQAQWPRISLTVGLAVGEALQQLRPGLEIGLKWPNDVCVQSRKICGILVEVPPRAPDRVVVGVGINVNNSVVLAPATLAQTAIALIDVTGYAVDLTVALIEVLHQIAAQVQTLSRSDAMLAHRWTMLCMLTGRQVQVEAGQRTTIGTCQGIDESGALLVDTGQGRQRCLSGIVTLLDT